jgi:hypothetical protein
MKLGLFLVATLSLLHAEVNVPDLVRRSVEASNRNWKEAPNYVFQVRELEEKLDSRGKMKKRTFNTYEVSVLDGSEYRRLVKRNDVPLSAAEQKKEEQKYAAERDRRKRESSSERSKRVGRYQKERQQDHAMMTEMTEAFNFKLVGEATVAGHPCYVLDATPKTGYVPKMRDTKVLTGMRGKMWVDKSTAQWVKVEAEVIRPVSFYAVATVGPGTKFSLEQEPVEGGVWLPKHFAVKVNSSVLFLSRNSLEDEISSNYRRANTGEAARVARTAR